MTAQHSQTSIPVVDVDQVFPGLSEGALRANPPGMADQGPAVRAAIRDVLGIRTRTQDPKAFTDALNAVFELVRVEGHIEARHVPRGYAVQADLGAVTGGQASLYRRASIARTEALRILDGLVPLRTDGDSDDMEAYRIIVRNAVQSLVDEMGVPGGPRVGMVDSYFDGLTGGQPVVDPDLVGGQLGALRDRFGLIDDNVNTIEEEGVRTAYWTLVDMVDDLRQAWSDERVRFSGASGQGFLGTELIMLSRLMEAAADQVTELETVLDSVMIPETERRTITLDDTTNLTLDGLLTWLAAFLSDEGRRLAQDAGRSGIVAGLAPTAVALYDTFRRLLADPCGGVDRRDAHASDDHCCPVRYLPTSCCTRWPAGMSAARVRIAVAGLCRLLRELAMRAQRVGRWAGVVLVDVSISLLDRGIEDDLGSTVANVEFRGMNLRRSYLPAFVPIERRWTKDECRLEDVDVDGLILPLPGSVTADDESISGLFRIEDIELILGEADIWISTEGIVVPGSDVPIAVVDTETGHVVHAPTPTSWPRLYAASTPRPATNVVKVRAGGAAAAAPAAAAPAPPPAGGPPAPPPAAQRRRVDHPRLTSQWAAQARTVGRPTVQGQGTVFELARIGAQFDELSADLGAREKAVKEALAAERKLVATELTRRTAITAEVKKLRDRKSKAPAARKPDLQKEIDAKNVELKAAQEAVAAHQAQQKAYEDELASTRTQLTALRSARTKSADVSAFISTQLADIEAARRNDAMTEGGK